LDLKLMAIITEEYKCNYLAVIHHEVHLTKIPKQHVDQCSRPLFCMGFGGQCFVVWEQRCITSKIFLNSSSLVSHILSLIPSILPTSTNTEWSYFENIEMWHVNKTNSALRIVSFISCSIFNFALKIS
jgi:hypothetical protein